MAPPSPVHPSSKHNPEAYPRARLSGWSNQTPTADKEAARIHHAWIRKSAPVKK